MKLIRKFWWLAVIVLVIGGGFFIQSQAAKAKEAKIKTTTVKRQDLADQLALSGKMDASEKASLRFQASGKLIWVGVKEGAYVKKFNVVASLDKRDLQNRMTQLLNTYSKTRNDFEQAHQDNKDWEISGVSAIAKDAIKRTLQDNQADLNNAVLAVQAQELSLKFANLITPIEGLVTKVDVLQAGVNVTPATATIEVVNPKSMYFSSLADQTEVTKFVVGQKGTLRLDAYPGQDIEGIIEFVGFVPKEGETGTVYELKVGLGLENTDYRYKLGMTGDINFIFSEKKDVLTIPESFIKKVDTKNYVTKMVNGKQEKVQVITGVTIDGVTEIVSGLSENETIYN